MNYSIEHRVLHFKQPAGTSRGVYTTRDVWYVTLMADGVSGVGECAPLPDLSCDALPDYEEYLHAACHMTCQLGRIPTEQLRDYPSMLFGLECAWRALHEGCRADGMNVYERAFVDGKMGIPINGLVWMGTYEEMRARLEEKLRAGYRCVKLKIGAINFDDELSLIRRIRDDYDKDVVQLRVDANGAFTAGVDAESKLSQLAAFDIHSIEQPIRQGQWDEMARLCATSRLPIALDEELIGVNMPKEKARLLDTIQPQYIVLKPSLHGGLSGCDEWIRLAEQRGIGWWATSALESNIGLTAIARWCASYHPSMPQGLGTGLLFTDNTPPSTHILGDELWMNS